MNHADSPSGARICAIAGGSGAGKTTLARLLLARLGDRGSHLTIDWYYHDLSRLTPDERAMVNFDNPASLDVELFVTHLDQLRRRESVTAPVYDFATHTRDHQAVTAVEARPIIVTEGIHLLGLPEVRNRCDLLVFIDVPDSIRLDRRVRRDVAERGRSEASVREQWATTVLPMHEAVVAPSASHADRRVGVDEDLETVADELVAELSTD